MLFYEPWNNLQISLKYFPRWIDMELLNLNSLLLTTLFFLVTSNYVPNSELEGGLHYFHMEFPDKPKLVRYKCILSQLLWQGRELTTTAGGKNYFMIFVNQFGKVRNFTT